MVIFNYIYDFLHLLNWGADMNLRNARILIGRNIHHWRLARRLPRASVAKHLGITLKRLQKYERGRDSPTCDELIAMAELFQCSVDDLCREAP